jgi:hypothetical protein
MMTINAAAGGSYGPRVAGSWLAMSGLGFLAFFVGGVEKRRKRVGSIVLAALAVAVISSTLLASVGCGGSSSAQRGTASVAVTAASGALTHTTMVTLTVQ